ncbi:exported protein of unknown function [Vibrio tapetis subsp. tapetis]|uniref:Uncharacterized protein n=1 Tax=Vibrio tapetis subsp. tapetis TaxID=1671868 RepID=A0A2N8ZL45_9VIBR|nr:exported protein of unknown function [Vibrio tapetis subsp. tapetis]
MESKGRILIMYNKLALHTTSLISICLATSAIANEIDYIPTPSAVQIADLNDDDNDGVINAPTYACKRQRVQKSTTMGVKPTSNQRKHISLKFCSIMIQIRLKEGLSNKSKGLLIFWRSIHQRL